MDLPQPAMVLPHTGMLTGYCATLLYKQAYFRWIRKYDFIVCTQSPIGDCVLITGSAHSASIVFGSVKTATCELVLVDSKQSRLHRRILPVHNMSRTPVRLCCSTTVDS